VADFTGYAVADFTGYAVADLTGHAVADFTGHPVADFTGYVVADFTGHPVAALTPRKFSERVQSHTGCSILPALVTMFPAVLFHVITPKAVLS